MTKTVRATGLAALGLFGVLSAAACQVPLQSSASTPGTTVQQTVTPQAKAQEPKAQEQGADETTTDEPTEQTRPRVSAPAGDPVPVANDVEVESSDGNRLVVRSMVHVNGGPDNGHWEPGGPTFTVYIGSDTDFYSALALCPGSDEPTLGKNGFGNRPCDASDAISTMRHNGSGMLAEVTYDARDNVTEFHEIYAP